MKIRQLAIVAALQLVILCMPWIAHADRLVASVYIEPSGDSPYLPFVWCNDKLWVEGDTTISLIDPLKEAPVWQEPVDDGRSNPWFGQLFGCTGSSEKTVLWLDSDPTGDELLWRSLSGTAAGRLKNILRSDYGYPLLDFHGALVFGIGSHEHAPQADILPPDMRLRYIDVGDVTSILGDNYDVRSLTVLSGGVIELRVWNYRRISNEIVLLRFEEKPAETRLNVLGSAALSRILSEDPSEIVDISPSDTATGATIRIVTKGGERTCQIEKLFEQDAQAYCADADDALSVTSRLPEKPGAYLLSPDGTWVAWVDWESWEDDVYRLYLASRGEFSPP